MVKKKDKPGKLHISMTSRTSRKRGDRLRRIGTVFALVVLICAILAGAIFAAGGLRAVLLSRNAHFTLMEITARSHGRLRERDIVDYLAAAGVAIDEVNLFALDLKALRHRLREDNVLVKDVAFYRHLPGTLEVVVTEPHPVARLRNGMLIDRDGLILPERRDSFVQTLPLFVGFDKFKESADATPGNVLKDVLENDAGDLAAAALRFLILKKTDPSGEFLRPILIQPDYSAKSLIVYLAGKGPFRDRAQIVIPADAEKMAAALVRIDTIARERYRVGLAIGFVDATYERNLPVRL